MPATEKRLIIEQGATFIQELMVDKSFNGATAAGKIRNVFNQPLSLLIATFTCTAVDARGAFTISLTAAVTAAIRRPTNARFDEYRTLLGYYDVELTLAELVARAFHGPVYLDSRQTR